MTNIKFTYWKESVQYFRLSQGFNISAGEQLQTLLIFNVCNPSRKNSFGYIQLQTHLEETGITEHLLGSLST